MAQVIFEDADVALAAAWIANRSFRPMLQLARRGRKLEVIGTDGYILVRGEVDADFVGWEDGRAVLLRDGAAMEELRHSLKWFGRAAAKRVELDEAAASFHLDGDAFGTCVVFSGVGGEALPMGDIAGVLDEEPEGTCVLAGENLRIAAKLANMVGLPYCGWSVEPHGPAKPVVMRPEPFGDDGRGIYVMVMPVSGARQSEGVPR